MFKPYTLFVGWRYFSSRGHQRFISLLSFLSIAGMVVGIAALIVTTSVMNGFEKTIVARLLEVVPHATIQSSNKPLSNWAELAAKLNAYPQVIASAPYIEGNAMLSSDTGISGVHLNGIDPSFESKVSSLGGHMHNGSLIKALPQGEFGIVLGHRLALNLNVKEGEQVTLVLPQVLATPAGVFPRLKRFTVSGIFSVGAAPDVSHAYINITDAARLYGRKNAVDGLRLRFEDFTRAPEVMAQLLPHLPNYQGQDWSQTQGSLFRAIRMERITVTILLMVVVFVAAFNIISILSMAVTRRRSDIALLGTLGAGGKGLTSIFLIQGVCIGLVGTLIGALVGILLTLWIGNITDFTSGNWLNGDNHFRVQLPAVLKARDVIVACVTGFALSLIASTYPAWRASKIRPALVLGEH